MVSEARVNSVEVAEIKSEMIDLKTALADLQVSVQQGKVEES